MTNPETQNPIGTCYECVAAHVLEWKKGHLPSSLRIIHGICVANVPGEEGTTITHAWFEWNGWAYDVIMGQKYDLELFRETTKVSRSYKYTVQKFMRQWKKFKYPGPWEEELIKIQKDLGKWDDDLEKLRFGKKAADKKA